MCGLRHQPASSGVTATPSITWPSSLPPGEAQLVLRWGAAQYPLAADRHSFSPQEPRWVQVLDNGQALSITPDSSQLFGERPLLEPLWAKRLGLD